MDYAEAISIQTVAKTLRQRYKVAEMAGWDFIERAYCLMTYKSEEDWSWLKMHLSKMDVFFPSLSNINA